MSKIFRCKCTFFFIPPFMDLVSKRRREEEIYGKRVSKKIKEPERD